MKNSTTSKGAELGKHSQASFLSTLVEPWTGNIVLALYSIPIWLLVIRRMDAAAWGWKIAAHAVIDPLYVCINWQNNFENQLDIII